MEKLGTPVDRTKVSIGLFMEYAKSFRTDVTHRWIENYFNQLIRPRLASLFGDAYAGDGKYYNIDEAAFEGGGGFLGKFLGGFERLMRRYRNVFTEACYSVLVGYTAVFLAREWERLVLASFRFSAYGALAFERDVRGVIGGLDGVGVRGMGYEG
jgi:hypothetical protein